MSGAVSPLSRVAGLVLDSPSNEFVLEEVPVVTPNGDVVRIYVIYNLYLQSVSTICIYIYIYNQVVPSLSLAIRPGQHVFITGPNGWPEQ